MSSKNPIESDEEIPPLGLEYEVFLSFRGPDTRASFTDHLYVRLKDAGIRVFRDDEELRKGEKIGPELLKGINQSKIAIPIFSKGYAASKWCLKELAQIVECMRTSRLKVMPIFYDVTPSEVRNQTGDYGKSFESHEKCYDENTIKDWKQALREVGELKGWDTESRPQGVLVKEVTNAVLRELKKAYLVVTNCLVGIEYHFQEVLSTIASNGVKIVVIHGMGGIGKTTLGKVIYNHLLPQFESHCFLADIKETIRLKGMMFLQEKLISKILNIETIDFCNIEEGTEIINERFYNKKVLLLLDDVDEKSQLKALMARRERLGYGSKIIITTRNKGIFDQLGIDRFYELSCLEFCQALQLFSQHAFRKDKPPQEHFALSQRLVDIAGGLPLALEVFGSLFYGKSKEKWISMVKKLEKIPHKEVGEKLRISFEMLDYQQQQIFLDISCFFTGEDKRIVIHFWDELEFAEEAIEVLQQMSLIKIQEDYSIWMHDQLRDLGKEIARQEDKKPEKRSRLWNEEEAIKILMQKTESDSLQGINLHFQQKIEYSISNEDFVRLPNLRLLRINGLAYKRNKGINLHNFFRKGPLIFSRLRWLSWHGNPPKTTNFSFEDLVILDLSRSDIKSSWSGWRHVKMAKNLKVLNLSGCKKLVKTPDLSSHPKLEQLILEWCYNLRDIDESISMLKHLVVLNLRACFNLQKLPKKLSCAESLEELIIDCNFSLRELPNWPPMKRLRVFSCSCCWSMNKLGSSLATDLMELSFVNTSILAFLDSDREGIKSFQKSIGDWASLTDLNLSSSGIFDLPDTIGNLKKLNVLCVRDTPIRKLPAAIGMLENLITLDASDCNCLVDIPRLPQSLISLKVMSQAMQRMLDLSNLINLRNLILELPYARVNQYEEDDPALRWIGKLINIESLTLRLGYINSLDADWSVLYQLTKLELVECYHLQSIPMLSPRLKDLSIECCESLETLLDLPSSLTGLSIDRCSSLMLLDVSYLRRLSHLKIVNTPVSNLQGICNCKSLQELYMIECDLSQIDGLQMIESLTKLEIRKCAKLQRLPDLSNLKKLELLLVWECPSVVEIPGRLESLYQCQIGSCKSLERIPDIPNSNTMGDSFSICSCDKLDKSLQK